MHPPHAIAEKTRPVFWGLDDELQILWYLLALGSVLVFAYGVAREVAKYRRGRVDFLPPIRDLWPRIRVSVRTLLSHSTIKDRSPWVGWAHLLVFYGWLVLFAGTIVLAINTDFTEPVFGWRFFQGDFYLAYSLVLDVLGLFLVAGLAIMMYRRGVMRPQPRQDYERPDRARGDPQYDRRIYRRGDWAFLILLLYLVITGYLLEGVRIAMDEPGYDIFSPAGWICAQLIMASDVSQAALATVRHIIWWSHGVVAIAFVASIPYTKASHMIASWIAIILRDDSAIHRLREVPASQQDQPAGYGHLSDFNLVHLLHLDACTKCGKCHEVCPARETGLPLSPRDVILELRQQSDAALSHEGIGGIFNLVVHGCDGGSAETSILGQDKLRPETIWSCMQCNACVEICPVGIEQAPIINQVRRHLVEEGELDPALQSTFQAIHRTGNSFGANPRKRGRWTQALEFEVRDARRESVDVLWFVGDYASFDPRNQLVTQSLARLLHRSEVDYGILFDAERNSGNDVRRAGEEGLFESLAEHNLAVLQKCDFNRIVTSDPHSLNTLRNEYPDFGGRWEVIHHTALLRELIESGRLDVGHELDCRVTFHDPCHMGRLNGECDNPRRVLELIGCEVCEMPRSCESSFCCGAGGGRIWIPDAPGTVRPSEERINEALALDDHVDYFVVTCPKDVTMYEDAIKTTGSAERIALREISELVEEAVTCGDGG